MSGSFLYGSVDEAQSQLRHVVGVFKYRQAIECSFGISINQLGTFLQAIEPDKGVLIGICANTLAHFFLGADDIQHIVTDLEG